MTGPSTLAERALDVLPRDAGPLLFVALVWYVQVRVIFAYVGASTLDIPFADEWEMIPVLTGRAELTLDWLWAQHNEHRIPLPRLVYLAIEKLSSLDFRAGAFFNAGALSLLAAGCCSAARRLRGRLSYTDAFFPLILLHCGQAENLTWSFQVVFVLSSGLVLLALMTLLAPGPLSIRAALGVGLCTLALPLTGGASLAFVPALACATILSGWQSYRARVRGARFIIILGASSLVLLALYFVGYERPPHHPPTPDAWSAARAALQFLVLGFGSGTRNYWDLSGYIVGALIVASVAMLCWLLLRVPDERSRVLRVGLFFGGMACLAGGIGWSRAGVYPQGIFASRYTTLAVPLFCAMYFSWSLVRREEVERFAQMLLFSLAAVLVTENLRHGQAEAGVIFHGRNVVRADIQAGVPAAELAARHCGFLYLCGTDTLRERILMLRDAQASEFRAVRE